MKKPAVVLATIFSVFLSSASVSRLNDRIGNGGSGVFQNEKYMTFYSAGFYVEPLMLQDEDMPELTALRSDIDNLGLSPVVSSHIKQTLFPNQTRKFFALDEEKLDKTTYETIKDEYRKVFKDDRYNLVIFAITHPQENTTYLMPEYNQLSLIEKKVILLHESLWILKPEAKYDSIAVVDMYFQKFLESPTPLNQFHLINAIDDFVVPKYDEDDYHNGMVGWSDHRDDRDQKFSKSLYGFALKSDIENKTLKGFLLPQSQKGLYGVKLKNFIGREALSCYRSGYSKNECHPRFKNHLFRMLEKYPQSLFLKALVAAPLELTSLRANYYRANVIKSLELNGDTPIFMTLDEAYRGRILFQTRLKLTETTCDRNLFGYSSCDENIKHKTRRVPFLGFDEKPWLNLRRNGDVH